ncbi:MAG: NAD(P)/FAD-dependent oxidoreductase [Clostridiales bacterium]|jgi:thioredoxin reductase (NADPH)|nr:NAD(P)/FAD-dependent oxidoreductase [Clostridiales bacterium]
MSERIDIAVIGGGPAGLSAAVNAVARGKSVRLFSAGENPLEKAENVDNYLGFYKISGAEMMQKFRLHAESLGITPEKGRVVNIMPMGDRFLINFGGNIVEASAVILAIGVAKAKEIPGEGVLLGRGVSYCATCDGMLYRNKNALVWGLAPDAVEETNFLSSIGVKVMLVAKGERPEELNSQIPFISGAVSEVVGEDFVTAARVGDDIHRTDGIFILRSAIAPAALVPGLETEKGYIKVSRDMETGIAGLYAAGDCTGTPLQISKAIGEGLIAAQNAAKFIDKSKS